LLEERTIHACILTRDTDIGCLSVCPMLICSETVELIVKDFSAHGSAVIKVYFSVTNAVWSEQKLEWHKDILTVTPSTGALKNKWTWKFCVFRPTSLIILEAIRKN